MHANIRIERDGAVVCLHLQRPERKNALTADMYAALADAIVAAADDARVRVLLITGGADCFTAGNDLGEFTRGGAVDTDAPVFRFLGALATSEKPVVAAVCGVAIGIGTTLLAHCDLVYAADDACFRLPFVNLGLCPEAASSLLLPRLAGHARASEWLLLGEPFSAEAAREAGLVNEVLPAADVLPRARARALQLAGQPPAAVRVTRQLLRRADRAAVEQALAYEAQAFIGRLASPEAAEAFAALAEKRPPDFSAFD